MAAPQVGQCIKAKGSSTVTSSNVPQVEHSWIWDSDEGEAMKAAQASTRKNGRQAARGKTAWIHASGLGLEIRRGEALAKSQHHKAAQMTG